MTDIALEWNADICAADLALAGHDLATDESLRTAVIISLFTDARASVDDVDPDDSLRGWWGDTLDEDGRTGSLLWLLRREKETARVLARAEGYAREALAWLIEDNIAVAIDVEAAWVARGRLRLEVTLDQRGGEVAFRFETPLDAL